MLRWCDFKQCVSATKFWRGHCQKQEISRKIVCSFRHVWNNARTAVWGTTLSFFFFLFFVKFNLEDNIIGDTTYNVLILGVWMKRLQSNKFPSIYFYSTCFSDHWKSISLFPLYIYILHFPSHLVCLLQTVYICMYVYKCIYVYLCVYICKYVCEYMHVCIYIYTWYISMYVFIYLCMYIFICM